MREALRGLEALGVVEILPFRGAREKRPTTAELMEAYAVRAELESLGARLAVPAIDISEVGFAEAYCSRQHGGKYGLKIARRAADDL